MHVIMCSLLYHPSQGGAETFVREVSEKLVEKGMDVSVVTGKTSRSLPAQQHINGVRVTRVNRILQDIRHSILFKQEFVTNAVKELVKLCRNSPSRVIHANLASYAGLAAVIAGRISGTKVVVTIQGGDIMWRERQGYGPYSGIINQLTGYVLRNANCVTALSRGLARIADVHYEVQARIIPQGVDHKKFKPYTNEDASDIREQFGLGNNPIIATVARLVPEKGIEFLIEALPMVDPKPVLVIVGRGPLETHLQSLAKRSDCKERIHFLGWQDTRTVARIMSTADLFVLPSVSEGLGAVILEAFACRTTVIASAVGGIPDLILNGENGILVPPRQPSKLSVEINRLLRDDSRKRRLAENGYSFSKNFSWNNIANQLVELYQNLS